MFQLLNKHSDYEVIELGETSEWELRLVIAEAGVIKNSPIITENDESNEALRGLMNKSNPIEVTEASKNYEIIFPDYITYAVRNESYTQYDNDECYQGEVARIYTKSKFLDFVKNGTFADQDFPGPFEHYSFVCLNHIIDVASMDKPIIKLINT